MRASPRVVVAAVVATLPSAASGQILSERLVEEAARAAVVFVSSSGTDARGCSISDRLLDEEVERVMRRYRLPSQAVPPPPETNVLAWEKTPILYVTVTGALADSRGRGCALFISTELVVARSWLPDGSEAAMLLPATNPLEDFPEGGREVLRVLLEPTGLTAARWGLLLIAPREERDRDVQRAVEDHVSEIAEALSRAR